MRRSLSCKFELWICVVLGWDQRVYESTFLGKKAIVKERFSKKYRHPILDVKLTQKRLAGVCTDLGTFATICIRFLAIPHWIFSVCELKFYEYDLLKKQPHERICLDGFRVQGLRV